jgi:hypothetical protein
MTDAPPSELGDQDDQQANRNAVAMITLCINDPDDTEAVAAYLQQVIQERGPMGMLEVLPALVWVSAIALTIMGEAAGIDPRETLRQVGQYHADDRNYHE